MDILGHNKEEIKRGETLAFDPSNFEARFLSLETTITDLNLVIKQLSFQYGQVNDQYEQLKQQNIQQEDRYEGLLKNQSLKYDDLLKQQGQRYEDQLTQLKSGYKQEIDRIENHYNQEITQLHSNHNQEVTQLQKNHHKEVEHFKQEIDLLKTKLRTTSNELRLSMGLKEKSEKGSNLLSNDDDSIDYLGTDFNGGNSGHDGSDPTDPNSSSNNNKEKYRRLLQRGVLDKRKLRLDLKNQGIENFKTKQEFLRSLGSDLGLIPPSECLTLTSIAECSKQEKVFSFDEDERLGLFGRSKGFQTSTDTTTRWDFSINVIETQCVHQNILDTKSGTSARKGSGLGPKNYQLTWRALANTCLLIAEYAIPMERISKILGIDYFSSSNIARWFQETAASFLPIYLYMIKELSHSKILRADDTVVLVLEMKNYSKSKEFKADVEWEHGDFDQYLDSLEQLSLQKKVPNLIAPVARELGRISQYADKTGGKQGVYLTLISGKSQEDDSRSTIFFYRTHFGQAGNLLSKIIENRPSQKPGTLIIQSDCANSNNLNADIAKIIKVIFAGCYAHGRRPFAKYVEQDENLSFYLLRAFALIAICEERAFRGPITKIKILRHRNYEKIIWKIIKDVCDKVVNGKTHHHAQNKEWKKGTNLFTGCQYIITYYDRLIAYLEHPDVFSENICIERNLRPEKMIEDAAKFRSSENGRVALDIHRTMIATSRAAEVDFKRFFIHILQTDPVEILANPQNFTPFALRERFGERAPPSVEPNLANKGQDSISSKSSLESNSV